MRLKAFEVLRELQVDIHLARATRVCFSARKEQKKQKKKKKKQKKKNNVSNILLNPGAKLRLPQTWAKLQRQQKGRCPVQ